MTLDFLQSVMADGTPIHYIMYGRVFTSSIASIMAVKPNAVYITLDDGVTINTANFGRSAFWSRCEAEKARGLT
jgi:hypothetical protein